MTTHDTVGDATCYLRFTGERGDGGEAGGSIPSHRFQHSDAGLQENPRESLSNGLEPQHVELFVAAAASQACMHINTQLHIHTSTSQCGSARLLIHPSVMHVNM